MCGAGAATCGAGGGAGAGDAHPIGAGATSVAAVASATNDTILRGRVMRVSYTWTTLVPLTTMQVCCGL
jgi:hypothetical protein